MLGGWPPAGLAEPGLPGPRTFWDRADQEGPTASTAPPPRPSAPVSLRNQKAPVQRRELGYSWHLWGKANASLLFKNIWCMSRADRSATAQSLAGGAPAPRPRACPPPRLRRPRAHVGRLLFPGCLCRGLAGPERDRISIKTKSSCHFRGEEPAALPGPAPCAAGDGGPASCGRGQEAPCPLATPHSLTPHVFVGPLSRARPTGARTRGRVSGPPGIHSLEADRCQAGVRIRALHSWGPTWSGCL